MPIWVAIWIAVTLTLGLLIIGIQLSTINDNIIAWIKWDTQHRASLERNKDA